MAQRILIVDDNDNADAARALSLLLEAGGHDVRVATDPVSALRLLDGFTPQVAVLDIDLPLMDGYELAARLREKLGPDACRLLAVTGYEHECGGVKSVEAGFEQHLVKPVRPRAMLAAVNGQAVAQ